MYAGRTIFAQIMDLFPTRRFHTCVRRYQGDSRVRRFTCLDQFRVMAFAQLAYRESLRDIEACLRAMEPKLYHMGIGHCVPRSTLAEANEKRDWRIFADIAQVLINRARSLPADQGILRQHGKRRENQNLDRNLNTNRQGHTDNQLSLCNFNRTLVGLY